MACKDHHTGGEKEPGHSPGDMHKVSICTTESMATADKYDRTGLTADTCALLEKFATFFFSRGKVEIFALLPHRATNGAAPLQHRQVKVCRLGSNSYLPALRTRRLANHGTRASCVAHAISFLEWRSGTLAAPASLPGGRWDLLLRCSC